MDIFTRAVSYSYGDKIIVEETGILQQKYKIMKNIYLLYDLCYFGASVRIQLRPGEPGWPLRGCHPPVSPKRPHICIDSEVRCRM